MSEDEYVAWCEAENGPDFGGEVARMEWQAAQIDPVDPESLRASRPFDGTGSVIDMSGVAGAPEYGKVAPISEEMLDAIFFTRTPSTEKCRRRLRWAGWTCSAARKVRTSWATTTTPQR